MIFAVKKSLDIVDMKYVFQFDPSSRIWFHYMIYIIIILLILTKHHSEIWLLATDSLKDS